MDELEMELQEPVHRFRWLWSLVFIPISIILVLWSTSTVASLKKEIKTLEAQRDGYEIKIKHVDDRMIELNAVSNQELMIKNYEAVNQALQKGVDDILNIQIQLREASAIADDTERETKLNELKEKQNKLFGSGFNGNVVFILNSEWKLEVVNTTPFATSDIPVVFAIRDKNNNLMGSAFATYYVQKNNFALHTVLYTATGLENQKNPRPMGDVEGAPPQQ